MKFEIKFTDGTILKSSQEYKNICAWNIQKYSRDVDSGKLVNSGSFYGKYNMAESEKIDLLITELEIQKSMLEKNLIYDLKV
jgi:hypothetical protein